MAVDKSEHEEQAEVKKPILQAQQKPIQKPILNAKRSEFNEDTLRQIYHRKKFL